MYTDKMRRAFHSILPPKNFSVEIMDNQHFLTIKLNERAFINMHHNDKIIALQYVNNVKKALELEGAIVLITREVLK
jgi:hypothetical protein